MIRHYAGRVWTTKLKPIFNLDFLARPKSRRIGQFANSIHWSHIFHKANQVADVIVKFGFFLEDDMSNILDVRFLHLFPWDPSCLQTCILFSLVDFSLSAWLLSLSRGKCLIQTQILLGPIW